MTEQEAKYEIIGHKPIIGFPKYVKALNIAIKALEEVQQYRAIGTVEELKESKEQYDNINCAAKSIQLSGLCDFENAKGEIISEIKRNYEYSLRDYETIGTPEECKEAVEVKKEITEIVNRQLIAGKDNYKETYNCFYEIVKIIQDNY